jgi:hypothetical protein
VKGLIRCRPCPCVANRVSGQADFPPAPKFSSRRSRSAVFVAYGFGMVVWLDVPYNEKDQAKAAGARWHPKERRWFAPQPDMPGLERWAARPPLLTLLRGEDRAFGSGLFVDMVPNSCWFTNVRSCVEPVDWGRLRRMVYGRAGLQCEICSAPQAPAKKQWLDAHERWEYTEDLVQRLRRIICLCQLCHDMTHYGFLVTRYQRGQVSEEYANRVLAHFQRVTGFTDEQGEAHIAEAWKLWEWRNQFDWTLDLSMVTAAGIQVRTPPEAAERAEVGSDQAEADRRQWGSVQIEDGWL